MSVLNVVVTIFGTLVTTVRLTTAEVVLHPHVCPVHITYSIFYTSAVTFFI